MKYYIYTYDIYLEKYTPQKGVRCGPHTFRSLLAARRKLLHLGYEPGSPSVAIIDVDEPKRQPELFA